MSTLASLHKDNPMLNCRLRDYAANELLDRYSDAGIDDEGNFEEMSAAARRAADARMARRDRMEQAGRRGQRAARRSHAPAFLGSDDNDIIGDDLEEEAELISMKKRTRKQYDERRDDDDLEGLEDVCTRLMTQYFL